jgi:hypothetical protein
MFTEFLHSAELRANRQLDTGNFLTHYPRMAQADEHFKEIYLSAYVCSVDDRHRDFVHHWVR